MDTRPSDWISNAGPAPCEESIHGVRWGFETLGSNSPVPLSMKVLRISLGFSAAFWTIICHIVKNKIYLSYINFGCDFSHHVINMFDGIEDFSFCKKL